MQRLVNGKLVDLTPGEIVARQAEEAVSLKGSILSALEAYRDYCAKHYSYKGVILRLGNPDAMVSLSTLYLTAISTDIHGNTVMADWQEEEGDIQITAGDLRADGGDILGNFQKAWTVFKNLKSQTFESIEAMEAAFDAAMEA